MSEWWGDAGSDTCSVAGISVLEAIVLCAGPESLSVAGIDANIAVFWKCKFTKPMRTITTAQSRNVASALLLFEEINSKSDE
jgi:hypothetical protein